MLVREIKKGNRTIYKRDRLFEFIHRNDEKLCMVVTMLTAIIAMIVII